MLLLIFTVVLLALGFLLQILFSGRVRWFRYLFFLAIFGILGFYFYLVYAQYVTWRDAGPPSSFLIPPHASVLYVFGYHFSRFGLQYLISFGISVLFFFAAWWLNRRFGERFFEREEVYLGSLSVFLLGDPAWNYAWMYYLILVLFLSVVGSLFTQYVFRIRKRFPLYFLWIPCALGVILIAEII
ncbi:MAG: hypothetical protein Q8P01_00235 [bacterium]|nr:hypothetical protein [bacterium]